MNRQKGEIYDLEQIKKILPHRYPFLLIDRITEVVPGKVAKGYKNVTANEPFFAGHFPQRSIMPGVLVLEAMTQAAGVCALLEDVGNQGKVVFLTGFDDVKFRRPVEPGDQLQFDVEVVKRKGDYWFFQGKATVDGELVAQAKMKAAVGETAN